MIDEATLASLTGAALIFAARLVDVSLGTLRVMYSVQGKRFISAILGLVESGVWIFAVSRVLTSGQQDLIKMVGYAMGFSAGTLIGVSVERLIASGTSLVRVISRSASDAIAASLRDKNFGVTSIRGEGRDGEVEILFIVTARRKLGEVMKTVRRSDESAFVTIEPISNATGGHRSGGRRAGTFGDRK